MKTSLLVAPLLCFGCFSSDPAGTALSSADQALSAPAPDAPIGASCTSLMRRQRDCSAEFIPALVQGRVEHDVPPGVRARDAAIGRSSLLSEAFQEWSEDSKDAAIARTCDYIARELPAERADALRSALDECLAESPCDAFTRCAVPINLTPWTEPSPG